MSNQSKMSNQMSMQKRKQAAYALNLCTVSVSQIVDYKDINILEQEYDAILNNLNLEKMPKDEPLLRILRQILDTITFFRMQEGDRRMMDREYQMKMRNAIWSAVPNFGLIVAGGSPWTMAISLASQVGIGYMNYRRNRNEYALERDKQEWQLQRTAIEQFNGLRRELFDTAWRLADAYKFPEDYRLTERQIEQYNKILLDEDVQRKYERLDAVKDKFEAYPPFWYFIGSSANTIAHMEEISIEEREHYRKRALEYFEKYHELVKSNLLREDQLASSCLLEHADLFFEQSIKDGKIEESARAHILELVDEAKKFCGNANDVLQLCAFAYLKVDELERAGVILKNLVNEDYNRVINAQILSSIYVKRKNKVGYNVLTRRVNPIYLFPWVEKSGAKEAMEDFLSRQKQVLIAQYKHVLNEFYQKYAKQWNALTAPVTDGGNGDDDNLSDSLKAKCYRNEAARRIFLDIEKAERYRSRLRSSDYTLGILSVLNKMFGSLAKSSLVDKDWFEANVVAAVYDVVKSMRKDIEEIQNRIGGEDFSYCDFQRCQSISLRKVTDTAFEPLNNRIAEFIKRAKEADVRKLSVKLREFCLAQGITEPVVAVQKPSSNANAESSSESYFGPELIGMGAVVAMERVHFIDALTKDCENFLPRDIVRGDSVTLLYRGDNAFEDYFAQPTFPITKTNNWRLYTLAIIKDNTNKHTDLMLTNQGVVTVVKGEIKNRTSYTSIKFDPKKNVIILWKDGTFTTELYYNNAAFDPGRLYGILKQIGESVQKRLAPDITYVEKRINAGMITGWFKSLSITSKEHVKFVVALSTEERVNEIGLEWRDDYERSIIQYAFDDESGWILNLRIVIGNGMDPNLEAHLMEQGGLLVVEP